MTEIVSRPYKPSAACEACVFGRGEQAVWCEAQKPKRRTVLRSDPPRFLGGILPPGWVTPEEAVRRARVGRITPYGDQDQAVTQRATAQETGRPAGPEDPGRETSGGSGE